MLSFSDQETVLKEILKRKSNYNCADCTTISPTWASLDFGVFLCSNCSGAHRSLGPTVTRVRSTKLDKWQADWVDLMQVGNVELNAYWQAQFSPENSKLKKPTSIASLDEVKRFVVQKYIKKKFVPNGSEKADPKTYHKSVKVEKQHIQATQNNRVSNNVVPRTQQQINVIKNDKAVDLLFGGDNNASNSNNATGKDNNRNDVRSNNTVQINSVSVDEDDDFGNFTDGGAVESSLNGTSNLTHSISVTGSSENSSLSFQELMSQNRQKEEQKRRQMQQMQMGMYNQHYQTHTMNFHLNMNLNTNTMHMAQTPYNNFNNGIGNQNGSLTAQQFMVNVANMPQHNPLQNYNYIQPLLHKSHSMGSPSYSEALNQDKWLNWQ